MFISGFTHKFKGESKAMYSQQIKSILRAVKGRSEYIDLSGVRMMSNEVYKKHNVSRNKYREACRYIRRMKKLGAGRRVQNLVDNLKKQYPQRRALLDELDSI